MHGASRVVLRASVLALFSLAAIVAACSDDSTDMEFTPGAPTYPEEDTGASSSGTLPGLPESSILPFVPGDAGDGDGGDAGDASHDGDADADAVAVDPDAGNDMTLGTGPLAVVFAGLGVAPDTQALTSSSFAGNNLNRWASAAKSFDHGTTVLDGTGNANGIAAWGHWTNGVATVLGGALTWPANGGAIYVVADAPTAIPTTAQTSLIQVGTTPVIVSDGTAAPGTISGSASMTESPTTSTIGLSLALTSGADSYSLTTTGGAATSATSELVADTTGHFAHTFTIASASTFCGGTCSADVRGFIAGTTGTYLAVSVHIYKTSVGEAKSVSAGVAFGP